MRILIVDDAAVMRAMLAVMLQSHGFEVAGEGASGNEAVAQYRTVSPDVAIVDVGLPDMDGAAVVRALLADDPRACIVAAGYLAQRPLVDAARAAGARGYVTKPFQPQQIAAVLESVTASTEDVREDAPNKRG